MPIPQDNNYSLGSIHNYTNIINNDINPDCVNNQDYD